MDDFDDFEIIGDTPSTPATENAPFTLFYGWMQKKSQRQVMAGWASRFFVLTSDWKIKYYSKEFTDDDKYADYKGFIDLGTIEGIVYLEGKYDGEGYAFQLIGYHRIWELFVKTHQELVSWVKNIAALRMNLIIHRKDISVLSTMQFERAYSFENFPPKRGVKPSETILNSKPTPFGKQETPSASKSTNPFDESPSPPMKPAGVTTTTPQQNQTTASPPKQATPKQPVALFPPCDNPRKLTSKGFSQHSMQTMTLMRWLNFQLEKMGSSPVENLKCLGDGELIVSLASHLTGTTVHGVTTPASSMREKMQNTSLSFRHIAEHFHVEPAQTSSHQMIMGNMGALEDGCWELIYMSAVKTVQYGGLDDRFGLMAWITNTLKFYSNIQIENFDTSFSDSSVFSALIHAHDPSAIAFNTLDISSQFKISQNLRQVFDIFHDKYGVPKLVEARDVLENPDEISIIIYLSFCFKALNNF